MAAQVKVEGLNRVVRTLKKAGVDIGELKDAHTRVGELVAAAAKPVAPRRSGALAGSIRAAKQARRAVVMAGGARVPYAGVQEYGWPGHNIAAQPYLSRAAADTEEQWLDAYLTELQRICDTVKGV